MMAALFEEGESEEEEEEGGLGLDATGMGWIHGYHMTR